MKKVFISNIALAFLIMNIIGATAIISLPAVVAKFAKQDAWITALVSVPPAFLLVIIICELGKRFPGMTIIEYSSIILGKWMGKLLGFTYFLFFIYINSVVIRQAGELIVSQIMQKTPVIVINLVFVMLAAYATYSGLEVISRMLELLLPWVIFFFTAVLLVGLAKADFARLLPVCGEGCQPFLYASIITSTFFGEAIVLSMYLPFILVALSILSVENSVQIFTATKEVFMPLGLLMEYFIPALLLGIALFRGIDNSKQNI